MESGNVPAGSGWLRAQAEKEAKADDIPLKDRYGQLVPIAGFIVVIVFIAIHQTRPTGFFTGESGKVAAALLYAMSVVGSVPMAVRLLVGRKNTARAFEMIGNAFFFVGQLYILVKFPFDFAHFADPLPGSLEFLLDWVSATLARVVLAIGIIGGGVFTVYTYLLYREVRKQLKIMGSTAQKTD